MHKAYGIPIRFDESGNGIMYFPIKREGYDYGGMPQFFGGTREITDNDDFDTIQREMSEESLGRYNLRSSYMYKIHERTIGEDKFTFYVVIEFIGDFIGVLNSDNSEMYQIDRFKLDLLGNRTIDDLFAFINRDPTPSFKTSETYMAFEKALIFAQAILVRGILRSKNIIYFPYPREWQFSGLPVFFEGIRNADESNLDALGRIISSQSDRLVNLDERSELMPVIAVKNKFLYFLISDYIGKNFVGTLKNSEMSEILSYTCVDPTGLLQMLEYLNCEVAQTYTTATVAKAMESAIKIAAEFGFTTKQSSIEGSVS